MKTLDISSPAPPPTGATKLDVVEAILPKTTSGTGRVSSVAKTMKAAFVTEFGKPLTIGELPVPEARDGQVLIKVEACGVCHTDVHAVDGNWPGRPTTPFTPGHEGIGRVVAIGRGVKPILGDGVKQVKEGDLVGVPWLFQACGACDYCTPAARTCAHPRFMVDTQPTVVLPNTASHQRHTSRASLTDSTP